MRKTRVWPATASKSLPLGVNDGQWMGWVRVSGDIRNSCCLSGATGSPDAGSAPSYRRNLIVSKRAFLYPALGLLLAVIAVLVWGNLADNLVYYLTPSEAGDQRPDSTNGARFRLGGLVEAGSVVETDQGVTFLVGDGDTSIIVVHTGTPPQLFAENVGVIVEGAWSEQEFHSDSLVVRHDEQYRSPDGEGPYGPPSEDDT